MNELQSDMVADDEVTGTLKYVNGYVDFSSNTSEQSGNYLALKIELSRLKQRRLLSS